MGLPCLLSTRQIIYRCHGSFLVIVALVVRVDSRSSEHPRRHSGGNPWPRLTDGTRVEAHGWGGWRLVGVEVRAVHGRSAIDD